MAKTQKQRAWKWCSRYTRLRDALEYCKSVGIDVRQFARMEDIPVKCVDCDIVKPWIRMDAGHYKGRGLGGSSGVYFDERNIHTQDKLCNSGFRGDAVRVAKDYEAFMLKEYGQDVLAELEFRHKNKIYQQKEFVGLELYYKQEFERLKLEAKNG